MDNLAQEVRQLDAKYKGVRRKKRHLRTCPIKGRPQLSTDGTGFSAYHMPSSSHNAGIIRLVHPAVLLLSAPR
jgi:hypothetical protein